MGMQEAFDFVARKLIEQGRRSVSSGVCKYRGDKGARCAVGWLIPDDQYDDAFNNLSSLFVLQKKVPALKGFSFGFLVSLMDAHDACANDFPRRIRNELRSVADEFRLDAGVLNGP